MCNSDATLFRHILGPAHDVQPPDQSGGVEAVVPPVAGRTPFPGSATWPHIASLRIRFSCKFHVGYIYTDENPAGKMLSMQQANTQQSSTHQTFRSALSRISPWWIIVLVWAAGNLLLLALQASGFGVGFHVHPLGEERRMIRLMANYPGLELHGQFWATLEKRNPLAPWWYQVFSPLIFLRPERALPFAKARGPLPGNLSLPAGR